MLHELRLTHFEDPARSGEDCAYAAAFGRTSYRAGRAYDVLLRNAKAPSRAPDAPRCHCGGSLDLDCSDAQLDYRRDTIAVPATCEACGSQYTLKAGLVIRDHVLGDADLDVEDYDLTDAGAAAKADDEAADRERD